MYKTISLLSIALALAACGRTERQTATTSPPPAAAAKPTKPLTLTLTLAPAIATIPLPVSSTAVGAGQRLGDRYTAYHDNISPPLAWGQVGGARSWVLLVEDPDANRPEPYVHWLAWNLPATVTSLPEGLTSATRPQGMQEGINSGLSLGWAGPKPPAGTGDHHYHFQIFALDTVLELPLTAGRNDVAAAMEGHVLASGETVGLYSAP